MTDLALENSIRRGEGNLGRAETIAGVFELQQLFWTVPSVLILLESGLLFGLAVKGTGMAYGLQVLLPTESAALPLEILCRVIWKQL